MLFLSIIGCFALLVGGYLSIIKYLDHSGKEDEKRKFLIFHSQQAQKLINHYNKTPQSERSPQKLQKELDKIINDPIERKKIEAKIENNKKKEAEITNRIDNSELLAIKYQNIIYRVFDTDQELEVDTFISKLLTEGKLSIEDSRILFNDFLYNNLIEECEWNSAAIKIGEKLEDETLINEEFEKHHISRGDWLKKNNKVLKKESFQKRKYDEEELDEFLKDEDDALDNMPD